MLDRVMGLMNSENLSKRLLIWKDEPDEFEHDLESD